MGWQDRGYNAGREEMGAYFANPLGLIQYALPIFRSPTLQIRLSFWFLLIAIFTAIGDVQARVPQYIPSDLAIMLGVCLWHEWGHRIFAQRVGGNHWEWVLWPLGGMVAPTAPRRPGATFVANVGGIAFNSILIISIVAVTLILGGWIVPLSVLFLPVGIAVAIPGASPWVDHALMVMLLQCCGMILINLYPCYWFDGGHLWQAVLWPKLGQWKSGLIVCSAGLILAVPFFVLSFWERDILGMLFWALIFADCFRRRQALKAVGDGGMDEEESSYNYMDTPEPRRKKRKKSWFKTARKRAVKDQQEQAKIDAILAKVKEKGLHSLTWWEKRTLRKATERQRQRDMASRL